ncbi:MAG: hypothetical protein M3513_10120 [Actinomycetota bacterium]|nr:hypothetical protein [Actinomycetota bacterium]
MVGSQVVFFSEGTGVDWNVIFLLLGMMIVVGGLRETGVFELPDRRRARLQHQRDAARRRGFDGGASSSLDAAPWTYIGLAPARREGGRPGPDGQPRAARTKRRCWRRS